MKNKTTITNRLINQKSPYLLQHAYNPVQWYPWSEEAFQKAKNEDKPIFLSIGYSTCHWCHVMERESFEDEEVAEVLNKYFVSIKVDREERPDIDNIYMTFCQAITGHGGWPLNIFMSPDKKPFYAGTYFPKESGFGRQGLIDVAKKIGERWIKNKEDIINSSEEMYDSIKNSIIKKNSGSIDMQTIHKAFKELEYYFEEEYGGFGTKPKFPTPHKLLLLLRYWKATGEKNALNMVEETLKHMYKGGIFDHVGFGFSRYSTDKKWLVPHFEKMLYDNALLIIVYLEAYEVTKYTLYKDVAEKIITYILRDMTSLEGGFYSAEDADSEGVEGKFYVWTVEEIKQLLGKNAEDYCKYYNITERGNFEGKNIPNLIYEDVEKIQENEQLKNKLEDYRKILFKHREKRVHPHKDDKILTSWNGLMIAAMGIAGRVLQNKEYIESAEKAFNFINNNLLDKNGRLLARYREGESANLGYLDDYAFTIWGLIELYEATFKSKYLNKALELNEDMIDLFWDIENGGLYFYGKDSEQLIARPKDAYDVAMPSGNSVAAMNMLKLSKMTGDEDLENRVKKLFENFGGNVKANPNSYCYLLTGLLFSETLTKEIVISGTSNENSTKRIIDEINKTYLPFATIVLNDESNDIEKLIPFISNQKRVDGKASVYICEDYTCHKPVTDVNELKQYLSNN